MAFRCLILVYLAFFCCLSFSTRFLCVNVFCNCVGCAIPGCPIFLAINGYYGQPVPGGYSHTLPIRVCAAHRGRDFEAPDLERGIHFIGVF